MDNRPIGVFDSGSGGLSAVKELRQILPGESIVYFGDTGRVPYGSRSRETILKYAQQDIAFLSRFDVKMIIAACGTVSAVFTQDYIKRITVPFTGVVVPASIAACKATRSGRIGVIGTSSTIRYGAYDSVIHALHPDYSVISNACPLFVPLVENGYIDPDNPVTLLVAQDYLRPFLHGAVDTLILGCTHYPLLAATIRKVLGDTVTLIDSGAETARYARSLLTEKGLLSDEGHRAENRFYVSDCADLFVENACMFLGQPFSDPVEKIDIDSISV